MCTRVTCRECGKATWAGCGQHVEEALWGVPEANRCQGHDGASVSDAATATGLAVVD